MAGTVLGSMIAQQFFASQPEAAQGLTDAQDPGDSASDDFHTADDFGEGGSDLGGDTFDV
jgi:hypothetical protein